MEELKQLIRDEKDILHTVDNDIKALGEGVDELRALLPRLRKFLERQEVFMENMQNFINKLSE